EEEEVALGEGPHVGSQVSSLTSMTDYSSPRVPGPWLLVLAASGVLALLVGLLFLAWVSHQEASKRHGERPRTGTPAAPGYNDHFAAVRIAWQTCIGSPEGNANPCNRH